MSDVFISYSRKDAAFVRKLNEALAAQGRDVWVDWEDIPLTSDWWKEICEGIEAADSFVFIISPDSVMSTVCRDEVNHAVNNNKRFIPILHRELETQEHKDAAHPAIGSHNWIFFREQDDFDAAFKSLSESIDTDLVYIREHTRLQLRALHWQLEEYDDTELLTGGDIADAEKWLKDNAEKNPVPTQLHHSYIAASRQAAVRRQRVLGSGILVLVVLGIMLAATLVFFFRAEEQRRVAEEQRQIAQRNAAESGSIALASRAQLVADDNQFDIARALGLEAIDLNDPPLESQRVVEDVFYHPGSRHVLRAHEDGVRATALYEEDDLAASADENGVIIIWNVEDGDLIAEWDAHDDQINAMAFTSDASRLVTADASGVMTMWDTQTGAILWQFEGHEVSINALEISNDDLYLVSGDSDGVVILWSMDSSEEIRRFEGLEEAVYAVIFNGNGTAVFASGDDETVIRWSRETGEERQTYSTTSEVNALAIVEDYLIAGLENGDLLRWTISEDNPTAALRGHTDAITSLDGHGRTYSVVSASEDSTIRVWNLLTGQVSLTLSEHDRPIRGISISGDGRHLISASDDGDVRYWDLTHAAQIARLDGHEDEVMAVAISADGLTAVSGSGDGDAIVWDLERRDILVELETEARQVTDVAFLPEDGRVLTGEGQGMTLWDVETGEVVSRFRHERVGAIGVSLDGTMALSGGLDLTVRLWNIDQPRDPIAEFEGHNAPPVSVAFSRNGESFVSTDARGLVIVWDIATQSILQEYDLRAPVQSAIYNPDGTALLVASEANITLIDLETGESLRQYIGHDRPVLAIAYSADGRYIISGSTDETLRVWNTETGEEVRRISTNSTVQALGYSTDGGVAITGAEDRSVRLWDIIPPSLDEVIAWGTRNRFVPELDCADRLRFRMELPPECQES